MIAGGADEWRGPLASRPPGWSMHSRSMHSNAAAADRITSTSLRATGLKSEPGGAAHLPIPAVLVLRAARVRALPRLPTGASPHARTNARRPTLAQRRGDAGGAKSDVEKSPSRASLGR